MSQADDRWRRSVSQADDRACAVQRADDGAGVRSLSRSDDGAGAARRGRPVIAVTREGERAYGLARGVDARHLRRLRRGEIPVDRDLDLHGLEARAAREDVAFELAEAFAAGERCVRIIHGRGIHSPGGPVLKEALLEWLQQPPLSARILAFSSAPPESGGAGALLVLLRRRRA